MPGFGTTGRTYNNALRLMETLGITIREVNIRAACEQHFSDIGLDPGDRVSRTKMRRLANAPKS